MKPRDLLADFDCGPGDTYQELLYARLLLSYLADHVYGAELQNGLPVRDATDFSHWLTELAEAARELAKIPGNTKVHSAQDSGTRPKVTYRAPQPQPRYSTDFCPSCGHVHIDDNECGFPSGPGGRVPCQCERKVTA